VSGVSKTAYWLGNYVQDYSKYLIFAIVAPLIIVWLDTRIMIDNGNLGYFISMVYLFGFPLTAYAYLNSFMFKSQGASQVFLFLINFLAGFVTPLITFIFSLIDSMKTWSDRVTLIGRIFFPTFCFGDSLFKMATRTQI
jgi:hypothetical protein